jgi:hypothetical protein
MDFQWLQSPPMQDSKTGPWQVQKARPSRGAQRAQTSHCSRGQRLLSCQISGIWNI